MTLLRKLTSELFDDRVLLVGEDKLVVYVSNKNGLKSAYLFSANDAGYENFLRYLSETKNDPVIILIDVVEEEFKLSTIPHVRLNDRASLLERKKAHWFRNTEYICVQNQGREKQGRKDDKLLVSALTKNEIIKPWLALLEQNKVPLKAITSVPLLLQMYIKNLPKLSDNALFVTAQNISQRVRQTFFKDKQLKISRLSKLAYDNPESLKAEVEKDKRYLNGLHLLPHGAVLDVYVLADQETLNKFKENITATPEIEWQYLNINTLLEKLKNTKKQTTPFCDKLFVSYLLNSSIKNHYALKRELYYKRMFYSQCAMYTASVVLLLFAIIYSGINLVEVLAYKQESSLVKANTESYQRQYDLSKEKMPAMPIDSDQIKVAVDVAKTFEKYKTTPREMLTFLGKALEQYPQIKLDELSWQFNMKVDAPSSDEAFIKKTEADEPPRYYQTSKLKVHVEPFDGNYREAIFMVERFVQTLSKNESAYLVEISSLPINVNSNETLSGDVDAVSQEALFSLRTVIGVN